VLIFGAALFKDPISLKLMAPIERANHLITLLALGWLWVNRVIERSQIAYFVFASISIFVAVISSGLVWLNSGLISFNYSSLDYVWGGACLFLSAISWVLLISSRHTSQMSVNWQSFVRWKTRGSMVFFIFLIGQTFHLLFAEPYGNMPLATEIATLVSLLILLNLARETLALSTISNEVTDTGLLEKPELEQSINSFYFELTMTARKMASIYSADACAFVCLRIDLEDITVEIGYNLLRGATIIPSVIKKKRTPRLAKALQARNLLRLTADGNSTEIRILGTALDLSQDTNVLAAPVSGVSPNESWGVILLRKLPWHLEDEINLETQTGELSHKLILFSTRASNIAKPELQSVNHEPG
jgi:hypothetical protein